MPLEQGSSEASLHDNIKKLMSEGKPRNQAVAIAYDIQKKAKEKNDLDFMSDQPCAEGYQMGNRKPTNQAGAANPLGFVYGGVANQYPYGG